ncbi:uncharacterized protein LOC106536841 [Austrofundulus limnaeus]|uniref:Uncharacterized protein LOC106536841 n=1 Tax=Austrofundulus limnaeus TaxID=52670 RepID=A0A2I4DBL3_AUSLI|nr:PREDICTED: uncharacterized protein LOC106536841 [Austrofundulus limnaeus]
MRRRISTWHVALTSAVSCSLRCEDDTWKKTIPDMWLYFFSSYSSLEHKFVEISTPVGKRGRRKGRERRATLYGWSTGWKVLAEFSRIASKNLDQNFFEALDEYAPRFFQLFSVKTGTVGEKLKELMHHMDLMTADVTARRTLVLKGLPLLLGDNSGEFYKTCFETTKEVVLANLTVGVLTILLEDGSSTMELQPTSTAVVVEGSIVIDNIKDFPRAVCLLFGLIYALHLQYPKPMENSLKFIQMVMLGLGNTRLPPKLQTLKNKLLSK